RVDARLICATNRDLSAMVTAGKFRDDLYYRVGVMTIELPPLRSYKDNLEILAQVFLQQAAKKHGRRVNAIARDAMDLISAYDFPGNMRELKNGLEHAVIMASSEEVQVENLPASFRGRRPAAQGSAKAERPKTLAQMREGWVAPHERQYLSQLLAAKDGKVDAAAEAAGVNRVTFYRLMKKHGLKLRRSLNPGG
ncbi:MAG: Fis family transcriptional regulator, partial [Myxococcaceae bacterium]|nr:Fis family transcriptional regulator [Myxococcaceae bacterium]